MKVVHGIDQADAEQVVPQPVDSGPREERVLRRRHPLGEGDARADIGLVGWLRAVEKTRADFLLRGWLFELTAIDDVDERRELALALALDAGEEGRLFPELLAAPGSEGVIVALSAFQLHAEEQPR